MTIHMTIKDAIEYLLEKGESKYSITKKLGLHGNMANHYLNGTRMRRPAANKMEEVYGIIITDVFDPTGEVGTNDNT